MTRVSDAMLIANWLSYVAHPAYVESIAQKMQKTIAFPQAMDTKAMATCTSAYKLTVYSRSIRR